MIQVYQGMWMLIDISLSLAGGRSTFFHVREPKNNERIKDRTFIAMRMRVNEGSVQTWGGPPFPPLLQKVGIIFGSGTNLSV